VGPGPWQPETIDVAVYRLVVEGDQADDGLILAGREVVGAREVLVAASPGGTPSPSC